VRPSPRVVASAFAALALLLLPDVLPLRSPSLPDLARRNLPAFAASAWERDPRTGRGFIGPLLGADDAGRCLLSRLVHGARISFLAALAGGAVCLAIGAVVGLFSGWKGGATDVWTMRLVDAADAAPTIAVVVLVNGWIRAAGGPFASSGARATALCAILGFGTWFFVARLVRAKTAWLRAQGFVEAALASGLPARRVVLRHVLPNLAPTLAVAVRTAIPRLMLFEAFLSFLGLGVEPPRTSLGGLARAGFDAFSSVEPQWRLLAAPCLVLALITAAVGGVRSTTGTPPPVREASAC
jgi:oligopeptide transport system permease protein